MSLFHKKELFTTDINRSLVYCFPRVPEDAIPDLQYPTAVSDSDPAPRDIPGHPAALHNPDSTPTVKPESADADTTTTTAATTAATISDKGGETISGV